MKFTIEREQLLKPLQQVSNSLSGRAILPILNHILLKVNETFLSLTTTDLEIEMISKIKLIHESENGVITVPAKKFFDICRGLPNHSIIQVISKNNRLLLLSGYSRFSLITLPAIDFPNLSNWKSEVEFKVPKSTLKRLIETTKFSMANQDVRYYLNGMLFKTEGKKLYAVATDGHRLALCSLNINQILPKYSVIIPRKGIIEFIRLLDNSEELITLQIGNNNIRAHIDNIIFTSKLIDGCFPDYQRVIPNNPDKILLGDCNKLKEAFSRAAILSNEKFRSVNLSITNNQIKITAKNTEKEESEEIVDVNYKNTTINIAFNVNYILDVLNALKCKQVNILLTDANSSIQIKNSENNDVTYVIMPMRI
ncbi:DNA polymerase III subunit beta [Arsenophonus symbiont of Ornithomya chloropus]|uniref:DNA polymerase III subunit beta n=1 Tax=Arsenophonus symbiont of Ornithomya chloropus TaxID=634121 RepID=UPI0032B307CF